MALTGTGIAALLFDTLTEPSDEFESELEISVGAASWLSLTWVGEEPSLNGRSVGEEPSLNGRSVGDDPSDCTSVGNDPSDCTLAGSDPSDDTSVGNDPSDCTTAVGREMPSVP